MSRRTLVKQFGFGFFTLLLIMVFIPSLLIADTAKSISQNSMSLTTALANAECSKSISASPPNPAVTALVIDSSTPCSTVTVSSSDATFTARAPLIPVVIGSGGELTFKDDSMVLYASSFLVKEGGVMQAGSVTNPIENQITVVMAGNTSASLAPKAKGGTTIVTTTNNSPNGRDITVLSGGVLKLYGGKGLSATPNGTDNNPLTNPAFINTYAGTQSWSYLSVPAGPASYNNDENVSAPVPATALDTTLTLATKLDWQPGDWISVATTSFSSHQTEIAEICEVASVANPEGKSGSITGASNASPIVVTTSNGESPPTGSQVTISGVLGNGAANGTWTVTNIDSSTFSLNGASGNGGYSSGGSWDMAEVSQLTLCTPLKHYHYGGLAPTPGFFPDGTSQAVVSGGSPIDVSNQAKSFYDDHDRNYGIDERAEVALLSRNIKFTSLAGVSETTIANVSSTFFGGHLAVMAGNGSAPTVELVGVELEKFGQPLVGRYPVHLHHLMSTDSNVLIQDVSVHHSYNKCFVVHSSSNADLFNNVCVRTVGQGVYLEDGDNITGNRFMRNLIAGTMAAASRYSYPLQNGSTYWDGDNLQATRVFSGQITNATNATKTAPIVITSSNSLASGDQVTISGVKGNTAANGIWTVTSINSSSFSLNGSDGIKSGEYQSGGEWTTPNNNWYNINSIADTSFSGANATGGNQYGPDQFHPGGFWITNLNNTFVNNSVAGCQAQGRGYWLLVQGSANQYAYPEFVGNRVHGCYNGIDTQPDAVNNVLDPKPTMSGTGNSYAPVFLLNGNTVTRSRQRGFWGRGIFFALHNNRFATNPYGFSLLGGGGPEGNLPGFWGLAHQNVIAGMTRNNVQRYPGCTFGIVPGLSALTWQTECTDVNLQAGIAGWGNYPSANMNIQGYSYYDGPARIEHNRFVNFRHDPTGIYPNDPAARLLTTTDIKNIASYGSQGQLEGVVTAAQAAANSAPSADYIGYAGDPATGWIQSNQQAVPPTQYIQNSLWDNVDFKHQVYTEAVNMGPFNDGDKNTVIRDKDGELSGYKVNATAGGPATGIVPTSLNNLPYFATDFTVDEPHSRGMNNFRESSLMSPHKYATLNIESAVNPHNQNPNGMPTTFRVEIKRDMPAYSDGDYPSQFLNGRGQNPIYEPFVMDRMGYTVYGKSGIENELESQLPTAFKDRLLFSYTDPAVKSSGDFFVNRIAVHQEVATPANIKMYRIHRQWGQNYTGVWPPGFTPPGAAATSCDGVFFENFTYAEARWKDCVNRGNNVSPYTGGVTLTQETDWNTFDTAYQNLLSGQTTVADFISRQTFYYDDSAKLLYFYMIEDQPVQQQPSPYGTCGGGKTAYAANVTQIQQIKQYSDPVSVQSALEAACLVASGTPQPSDLFTCGESGCAAYLVDFTNSGVVTTTPMSVPSTDQPLQVIVTGVKGNTAANGTWPITTTSANTFTLNGVSGNSSYASGGTWQTVEVPIINASNESPITITSKTSAPATGMKVTITGVIGNTAANKTWTVTNTGANTFTLNGSSGNGAYTSGGNWQTAPINIAYATNSTPVVIGSEAPCSPPCDPPHPITRSSYNSVNQYELVYSVPAQQPNGLPVVQNLAVGNTAPPTDGGALTGKTVPKSGKSPSKGGNQVTYSFLPLSGPSFKSTADFLYRCVTTPPWSPVNARGTYPAPSGKYILANTLCSSD